MLRQSTARFLALLAVLFAFLTSFADAERKVRVGYYSEPGMMNGAELDAVKSGYAYEYIQEIANHAGWRYDYVYATFDELYEKLKRGEIDLLPYVNYSETRAKEIAFPVREMGAERFYLSAWTREAHVEDLSQLAGKKVGTDVGTFDRTPFVDLMKAKGIDYELVEFDGVQARWDALRRGAIDYSIETSSMRQSDEVYAVYALPGEFPYHLAVAPGRGDLLAELNAAQDELAQDNPGFLNQLKFEYFGGVPIFKMLSARAANWLKTHDAIRIGSYEGMRPFVYRDEKGEVVGMAPDCLRKMLDELGVKIPVEWTLYNGRESGLSALKQNEVDLIYPYYHNRADAEREDVVVSSVVFRAPFGLLYRGQYAADTLSTIATPAARLGSRYVRDEYPRSACVRCGTGLECLKQVQRGAATCAILYLPILQQLAAELDDDDLSIKILNAPCNVCFAARPADAALIGRVNKAIPYLTRLQRNEIENRHAIASSVRISAWQFFRMNPLYVFGAAVVLLMVVILYLSSRSFASHSANARRSLEMLRLAKAKLAEEKTLGDHFMTSFALACSVDLTEGTCRVLVCAPLFAAAFAENDRWRENLTAFVENHVRPEDRPTALRLADDDYVRNRLKTEGAFSFTVRAAFGDETKALHVTAIRCGADDRLAVSFTDVTDGRVQAEGGPS